MPLLDREGNPINLKPDENLLNEALASEPKLDFIFCPKSYFNQDGLRIEENTLVSGAFPEDFPRFVAYAMVTVDIPLKPGQRLAPGEAKPQHKKQISVPLKATTIVEAYAAAPAVLQEEAEKYQAFVEEQLKTMIAQGSIRKELTRGIRG